MLKIDYEILDKCDKVFVNGKYQSLKYRGQIVFNGLTLKDRVKLKLPLEKLNPNFDPNEIDCSENPEKIPMTNEDTFERVVLQSSIKPVENSMLALKTIQHKFEIKKKDYEGMLVESPKDSLTVVGDKCVETLKTQK